MKTTVACVLWIGDRDFEGRAYTVDWVYRLRDQVAAHLPMPHRFVCFSDTNVPGVESIPLVTRWRGWWAKMEMFDPRHDLGQRVLYLDLDCFVVDDLQPIVNFHAPMALAPASYLFTHKHPTTKDGVVRVYQSSCMVWSPPAGRKFFEDLTPEAIKRLRGDQDWMGERDPTLPIMPPSWFAKAYQCEGGVPVGTRVVLAHRYDLVGRSLREVARMDATRVSA